MRTSKAKKPYKCYCVYCFIYPCVLMLDREPCRILVDGLSPVHTAIAIDKNTIKKYHKFLSLRL